MKENKRAKGGLALVLPILALPFLTFVFWALGGGRSSAGNAEKSTGINAALPDAQPEDDSALDKMAFYDQAEKAAGKALTDSFTNGADSTDGRLEKNPFSDAGMYSDSYPGTGAKGYGMQPEAGTQEETRIRQRMQDLQHQLEAQANSAYPGQEFSSTSRANALRPDENELPEIALQQTFQDTTDAEMEQLQSVMNRIYDIQHPDEAAARLKAASEQNRGTLYPVTTDKPDHAVHFLSAAGSDSTRSVALNARFYGLATSNHHEPIADKAIRAVTQQDQVLVNGASLKLRLLQEVYANGLLVPKGTLVTGTVQLNNDRLQVEVTSLLSGQNLLQVKLVAYDTDGMEGLNIPGSINREVVRQSGDNTLQGIGVGTLNPSIGAQAAAAGIETAKTLFSRKLKLTKVLVKAGHQLLLKNQ